MKPDEVRPRFKWYSYMLIALLSVLLLRLAVVQLLHNTEYQAKAKENRVRLVPIKAPAVRFMIALAGFWPPMSWSTP